MKQVPIADLDPDRIRRLARFGSAEVYFVRSGRTGPVKIGMTTGLVDRILSMQIGNPEPLYYLGGIEVPVAQARTSEARVHVALAGLRLRGEWFAPEPELLDAIECVQFGGDLDDICKIGAAK